MVLTIMEAVSIMVPETTMEDSETKTVVIREIRITKTVDSETRTAVDLETKTAVAGSEILKAVQDQSLQAEDSETAQAAKAVALQDNRAAEAALDKTIINNETNS